MSIYVNNYSYNNNYYNYIYKIAYNYTWEAHSMRTVNLWIVNHEEDTNKYTNKYGNFNSGT